MNDQQNQEDTIDLPTCGAHTHSSSDVSLMPQKSEASQRNKSQLSQTQLSTVTTMLKALADSNRLQLLLLLQQSTSPLCVSEIAEQTDEKITTVSNRLKQLYAAGLVSKERDGQHILYGLQDDHVEALLTNLVAHATH
ncbi:ArsR/SmtB family transcription factor [Psychrobacter sp. I-STPA10]|uniref:ArsR/SmtB family transcription factor n=1 Tax=Psychrobacter sp. I-STPA10 TaxID=2585769 RepID=UPI001E3A8A06|nr:metalloregulator ArsR/SmtB family transcription factor [Psychrobacter sp. I-STPA10]